MRSGKLKILFAIESYPPDINGSGIATKRIATGLAHRGYKVGVICPGKDLTLEKTVEDGVMVFRIGSVPVLLHKDYRFAPFAGNFVGPILKEFQPDLVHLADAFPTALAAFLEAKKLGLPIIGTNHFHPDNLLHYLKLEKNQTFYETLEKLLWDYFRGVFNHLHAVTVPSETAAEIIRSAGIKCPVYVISNGLDLKFFDGKEVDESVYSRYGIDKSKVNLVSVSRLEKEKRIDVLLKALSLIKNWKDIQLIIVGSGKGEKPLRSLAKELDVSDKVVFTGAVSDEDLRGIYSVGGLFLSASEVELQGLSIMEAMAYGLPIVAARSMAVPELVEDGVNGYLFEAGDFREAAAKIAKIISDGGLRKSMSRQSLMLIKRHDIEKTIDRIGELYSDILAKSKPKRMEEMGWRWKLASFIFPNLSTILVFVGVVIFLTILWSLR